MGKTIDCIFVGHNSVSIKEKETQLRVDQKRDSYEYRELGLNYIEYNKKKYTPGELFNHLYYNENQNSDNFRPKKPVNRLYAIAYLGSYLAKRGLSIDYVNDFRLQKEILAEKLSENNVLCVAIPTTLYVNTYPIKEIIDFIKKHNTTAKIIVGGPYVLSSVLINQPEQLQDLFKNIGADYYINSAEGEAALAGVVHSVKNSLEFEDINNIYYWNGTEYKFTRSIPEDNDLEDDTIDWSLFTGTPNEAVNIRTSRSCPFSCSFCHFPTYAGAYKTTSVEFIEKALNNVNDIGTVREVSFVDDTFNVPVQRYKQILRMMIKNKYKFAWNSYLRCQYLDRETVELMKESNCNCVTLGIESGSQKVLDIMNKAVKVEDYYKGISLLNEYGIPSIASFFMGFPGETYETFKETVNFIEESKPTFYRTELWVCAPLSPIYENREKYNIQGIETNWSHNTMDSVTAGKLVTEMFMSIKNSIRLKDEEFGTLLDQMTLLGLGIDKLTSFYRYFNEALKDKIRDPKNLEVNPEIIERLKSICRK